MNFKFANKIGDSFTVTYSAEQLQEMINKFGIHLVYDYENGSSDADTEEYIKTPEALVEEFPQIPLADAKKYFAGEGQIYDVRIENEGRPYLMSFDYPIPEIGYEN